MSNTEKFLALLIDHLPIIIPFVALCVKTYLASHEARLAKSDEAKARAAAYEAELRAEMERLAAKAIAKGVQKLKEGMTPAKKAETNSTIQAITSDLGVEEMVHKLVEEVKKEEKK